MFLDFPFRINKKFSFIVNETVGIVIKKKKREHIKYVGRTFKEFISQGKNEEEIRKRRRKEKIG